MGTENDPTKKYLEAVDKYQSRLTQLWKVIFKRVASSLKALVSFMKKLVAVAKQIATVVGKSVIDKFLQAANMVQGLLSRIPNLLKAALRLGKKIIELIRKAADPNKILGTLKKLFIKYIKMLKEIYAQIIEMVKQLDVLGTVLTIISNFKSALQLMFSWIAEVTRANDAVNKARKLLKKAMKEMKSEMKQATVLRKEVMKLKAAA
ncbi:hypothetical protein AB2B41_11435 [Marimonas sp. MJW-29]|uniref:Uncharacterized protein n=1 Tax=Sulfitobacter sediminis TaxID=3234186 RepID=A0ABV3RNQ5_9RHOB